MLRLRKMQINLLLRATYSYLCNTEAPARAVRRTDCGSSASEEKRSDYVRLFTL